MLGLFFISIGMLVNPSIIPDIWLEAVLGALLLLAIKFLLVAVIVRASGIDLQTALRTGLLLAVGGEFGFALLAIGIEASILETKMAQIALMSVLFSMILAPFLIRYNQDISGWFVKKSLTKVQTELAEKSPTNTELTHHVVISGYGRIGQVVARLLEKENISYIAIDMDPGRVKEARLAGEPIYYGNQFVTFKTNGYFTYD